MFKRAVNANLLLLIKKLAGIRRISSAFYLAGGTALALQLGHRRSDDIDLFSLLPFNAEDIRDIACMKAAAISQRAEKKDFFDMYELSFFCHSERM